VNERGPAAIPAEMRVAARRVRTLADMWIHVNGEPREVEIGATVAALLAALGVDPRRVAVEKNREIVPRAQHGTTPLVEGDRVEIVTMVGGG
jgi:sulfur carrier protein